VLFVYEQHEVIGKHEAAFEDAYRMDWAPQLAKTSDARLLWYFNIAHGAGHSYQIVTLTGLANSKTWAAIQERLTSGDLMSWLQAVQSYRYRVVSKVLIPEGDSRLELDLAALPAEHDGGDPGLYVEEVVRPTTTGLERQMDNGFGNAVPGIELFASFSTAFGTGPTPEITRLYKIKDLGALVSLMTREPPRHEDGREQDSTSRLLRTAPWSPLR
jgi:hypothetical protein